MLDNPLLQSFYPEIASESLNPLRKLLAALQKNPPQVLLFDGGTELERRSMAKYWASLNLCPNLTENGPCLKCPTCLQINEDSHLDILAFDGYISKKEDEDSPGFYRTFNAENARNLKLVLRDAPHGRYRIVFFTGIVASRAEAPNALLKVLEEPSPYTLFVLLVPQRAQILPTLVSRSFCLTLPWPWQANNETADLAKLMQSMAAFLNDREDFLAKISSKNVLTLTMAQDFLVALQKTIIRILSNEIETPLDHELANLSAFKLMQLMGWIREAQSMLAATTTPARVIMALSMRCYVLRKF